MMKINWKVRIQHRQFWVAIVSASILLANHIASLFNIDITLISFKIQQLLETILLILTLFGIIIDPTTVGVNDSSQVMDNTKPRNEAKVGRTAEKIEETHQETKIEVHHETKIEVIQQQQESNKDKVEENPKK